MVSILNEGEVSIDLSCLGVENSPPSQLLVSPVTEWDCSPTRSPSAKLLSSLTTSSAGSPAADPSPSRSPISRELETKLRQRLLRSEVGQDGTNMQKMSASKRDGSRDGAHTPQMSQPPQRPSSRRSNASGCSSLNSNVRAPESRTLLNFEPVKLSSGWRRPPRVGALTRTVTEPEPLPVAPQVDVDAFLATASRPSAPLRHSQSSEQFPVLSEKFLPFYQRDAVDSLPTEAVNQTSHAHIEVVEDSTSLCSAMRPLLKQLLQENGFDERLSAVESNIQDLKASTYIGFDEVNTALKQQATDRHEVEKNHLNLLNRAYASMQASMNKVNQNEQTMQGLIDTVQKTRDQVAKCENRFRSLNESILGKLQQYALDAVYASAGDLREDFKSSVADLQQKIDLKANATCKLMDERWASVDKAAHDLPHMVDKQEFNELSEAFSLLQKGLDGKSDLQSLLDTKSRVALFEVALQQKASRSDISEMVLNVMATTQYKSRRA